MPPKQLKPKSTPKKRKYTYRNESARRRLRVAFDEDDTSSTNDPVNTEDEGPPLQKDTFLQSPSSSNGHNSARQEKLSPKDTANKRKRVGAKKPNSAGGLQKSESFIMKLFDRSLDLSIYAEKTPLYPICRAWMANRPRNTGFRNYREATSPLRVKRDNTGEELLEKLNRGWLDVYSMPQPSSEKLETKLEPETSKPNGVDIKDDDRTNAEEVEVKVENDDNDIEHEKNTDDVVLTETDVDVQPQMAEAEIKEEINEETNKKPWEHLIDSDLSHESIFKDLKEKWTSSRKRGQQVTHSAYHQRYDTNRKIIQLLYVRTSALKQSTLYQNRH